MLGLKHDPIGVEADFEFEVGFAPLIGIRDPIVVIFLLLQMLGLKHDPIGLEANLKLK